MARLTCRTTRFRGRSGCRTGSEAQLHIGKSHRSNSSQRDIWLQHRISRRCLIGRRRRHRPTCPIHSHRRTTLCSRSPYRRTQHKCRHRRSCRTSSLPHIWRASRIPAFVSNYKRSCRSSSRLYILRRCHTSREGRNSPLGYARNHPSRGLLCT